jgi:hypothetical protein
VQFPGGGTPGLTSWCRTANTNARAPVGRHAPMTGLPVIYSWCR